MTASPGELRALLLDGEWWQTVVRGPNPTSFSQDMTHVARAAAARIAELEGALERLSSAIRWEHASDGAEAWMDARDEVETALNSARSLLP